MPIQKGINFWGEYLIPINHNAHLICHSQTNCLFEMQFTSSSELTNKQLGMKSHPLA